MHPHNEHLFVVTPVEDSDLAAIRHALQAAPQIIVIELVRRGRFEGIHLATLRIYAGHHMLDSAVLAGCIHRLKNDEDRPLILGIEGFL